MEHKEHRAPFESESLASYLSDGKLARNYSNASPFPHAVIDDFFDEAMLSQVLQDFPDLDALEDFIKFESPKETKLASRGERHFPSSICHLMRQMNSEPFLHFLQQLTGIDEQLIPDPHFYGGGMHQIRPGGVLKIHADFSKHEYTNLDRRINVLIYLNKDWREEYGGHLELWNSQMSACGQKILPLFNRMVVFSTTPTAYHGHPNPLACPPSRSRKSLALYYYTNGRPAGEVESLSKAHSTKFLARMGNDADRAIIAKRSPAKAVLKSLLPPVLFQLVRALRGKVKPD